MKIFMLFILFSVLSVMAQQTNASVDRRSSATSSVPLSRLNLNAINSGQKQHLKIYSQVKQLRIKNRYSHEQGFEPLYSPFVLHSNQVGSMAEKAAYEANYKANDLQSAGKSTQAQAFKHRAELFMALANVCKDAGKEYKAKHPNKLNTLMEHYKELEMTLVSEGVKLPKREWLSPVEAELLIREYTKLQKMKK